MSQKNPFRKGGKWFFYDETWSYDYGPYETEEQAKQQLALYCQTQLAIPSWGEWLAALKLELYVRGLSLSTLVMYPYKDCGYEKMYKAGHSVKAVADVVTDVIDTVTKNGKKVL